jgi:hypothetical protein
MTRSVASVLVAEACVRVQMDTDARAQLGNGTGGTSLGLLLVQQHVEARATEAIPRRDMILSLGQPAVVLLVRTVNIPRPPSPACIASLL